MGLSFFNAERAKKQKLEQLNKRQTPYEEPTSPSSRGEVEGVEEREEVVKPVKRKRK